MVKTIEVTVEMESGLKIKSLFMYPQFRDKINSNRKTFKVMSEDPIKWFKDFLKGFERIG